MSYFDPDLTGSDVTCAIHNYLLQIYQTNQIIKFQVPIYYNDTLIIKRAGTEIELEQDEDYIIEEKATTLIGEIKVVDNTWDHILVESIKILNPSNDNYQISLSYQQIFPSVVDYEYYNNYSQLEFTPELIMSMLDKLKNLEATLDATFTQENFSVESLEQLKITELDINKENPNNVIEDEEHTINTMLEQQFISPIYGSFFKDSVTITDINNIELVEDTDYKIVGINFQKTKVTANPSGVYDFIKITKEMVGPLKVTYHAFGGLPSLINFKDMYNRLYTVINYLSHNQLITRDSLSTDPSWVSLFNKVYTLEEQMRNLLSGTPTYADATYGLSTRKRISTVDNNLNWWTIASLYLVEGSPVPIMKDAFNFRLELLNSGLDLEVSVIFDATKSTPEERLQVTVINNNTRSNLVSYQPHIRIIYNQNTGSYSGAYLQIGFSLQDFLQDTLAIDDKSGKESCWKLIPEPEVVVGPENDNILLPDETTIWIQGSANSQELRRILPLATGFPLLTTSTPIDPDNNDLNIPIHVNLTKLDLLPTKMLELDISINYDTNTTHMKAKFYITLITDINDKYNLRFERSIILLDEQEYIFLGKYKEEEDHFVLNIRPVTTYISNPSFTINQIRIYD